MGENSKIEWTKHTANLWWGCTEVHAGCDNCYARVLANRWGWDVWGNDKARKATKSVWNDLKKYQAEAKKVGEIHRVFVGSMMDIFEKPMPLVDSKGNKIPLDDMDETGMTTGDLRDQLFRNISNNYYPNLMFLLLTKRPSNINKYIPESWKENPPKNVMFGTSPVNQETADKLIFQLLCVKGLKFLSIEPQLGEINLTQIPTQLGNDKFSCLIPEPYLGGHINWVINGGESGGHKRPFNAEWARKLRDDCREAYVPFFMKQMDKVKPIPEDLMIRQFPNL